MKGRQVGLAITGCGDLTRRALLPHLSEPDAKQKVAVIGLHDVKVEAARQAAESFGVPHVARDLEDLIELPGVELLVVATPVSAHADAALAALRSGKHLYLQKPMATNLSDAERVLAAAARAHSKVLAAPLQRLCPVLVQVREALQRAEIGPVYWALTTGHWPFAPGLSPSRWDWLKLRDAGPLRDTTIYSLTTLTDLFGPVRSVAAASSRVGMPADEAPALADNNTVLALGLEGGVLAVATGGFACEGRVVPAGFLGIYGAAGSIETTGIDPATWYPTEAEVRRRASEGPVETRLIRCPLSEMPYLSGRHASLPEAQAYVDVMHLVDSILQDTSPLPTLEQARHVVEVIDRACLAAETGQRQCVESRF